MLRRRVNPPPSGCALRRAGLPMTPVMLIAGFLYGQNGAYVAVAGGTPSARLRDGREVRSATGPRAHTKAKCPQFVLFLTAVESC